MDNRLNRRNFISMCASAVGAATVAGCSTSQPKIAQGKPVRKGKPNVCSDFL